MFLEETASIIVAGQVQDSLLVWPTRKLDTADDGRVAGHYWDKIMLVLKWVTEYSHREESLTGQHGATQPFVRTPVVARGRRFDSVLYWMICLAWMASCRTIGPAAYGQDADGGRVAERFEDWPLDLTVRGRLVITDSAEGFREVLASQTDQESRRIKAASPASDALLATEEATWWILGEGQLAEKVRSELQRSSAGATQSMSLGSFMQALPTTEVTAEPLETQTGEESGLGSAASRWVLCDERPPGVWSEEEWRAVQSALQSHLQRGATVCCVGPMARAMGKHFLPEENHSQAPLQLGWNLMPDALLVWKSLDRVGLEQVRARIAPSLRVVTMELEPNHAVMLEGRKVRVFGVGAATVALPASEHLASREQRLLPRQQVTDRSIDSWLIDWTQWRRESIERTLDRFPPSDRETPVVERGALVIVGGGGMPQGLMRRFIERAGGASARIVYVPCIESEDAEEEAKFLKTWQSMGVTECVMLHTKDRQRANEDQAFLDPLRTATGIWFGGGRQWNLADSYYGTTAHRLMKQVLERDGVVGGSSAGASIQANYLARATPIENFRIMAPGYERGGLGFLRGVAIDQHFSQRNRQQDLRSLVETYPQLLGIGIDEATAIWVTQSQAEVVGKGNVYFYSSDPAMQAIDETRIGAGGKYDLKQRRVIE
jgi:cyanophycinase